MKALANGVLNATVADGWAHEVEWQDIGWELQSENIANQIYTLLEGDIINEYYERSPDGIPEKWVQKMRKGIQTAEHFSTKRVLEEYYKYLYK